MLIDEAPVDERLRHRIAGLLGGGAGAVEPSAAVGGGGRDPCSHREAIGIEVLVLEERVELSRSARALLIVGAAQRADRRGREERVGRALSIRGVDQGSDELRRLHCAPRDVLPRRERQIGARLDVDRLVLVVGDAEADAAGVVERSTADLRGDDVRSGRGIDLRGEAIEAHHLVHVVALVDVDAVEDEARGARCCEAHDDRRLRVERDLRRDPGAAFLAGVDEEIERDAARLREGQRDLAPRDLDRAPRVDRLRIDERRGALLRLGAVVSVETAAGVAERTKDGDCRDDACFGTCAARARDGALVRLVGARERRGLATDLGGRGERCDQLSRRLEGRTMAGAIRYRCDDAERGDPIRVARRRDRPFLLSVDRRLGGLARVTARVRRGRHTSHRRRRSARRLPSGDRRARKDDQRDERRQDECPRTPRRTPKPTSRPPTTRGGDGRPGRHRAGRGPEHVRYSRGFPRIYRDRTGAPRKLRRCGQRGSDVAVEWLRRCESLRPKWAPTLRLRAAPKGLRRCGQWAPTLRSKGLRRCGRVAAVGLRRCGRNPTQRDSDVAVERAPTLRLSRWAPTLRSRAPTLRSRGSDVAAAGLRGCGRNPKGLRRYGRSPRKLRRCGQRELTLRSKAASIRLRGCGSARLRQRKRALASPF